MNKLFSGIAIITLFMIAPLCVTAQQKHSHDATCVHTKGYAAIDAVSDLVPYEFDRRPVGDNDILINIEYAGICHSDIHTVKGDWGNIQYPCVPGHEIVGKVTKVGKNVKKFKVGDLAGVGCMVNSCGECENCLAGHEQFCNAKGGATYTYASPEGDGFTQGGYSNKIVVKESFAIMVPKNVPIEKVAPLLCAGITTYSPLKANHVKKGDKVAVAGFGGLGHMAVQYAISMGAEVTIFDITEDKRQAALEMGAAKYINTTNKGEMEGFDNSFNLIISTIPFSFDVAAYMRMLKLNGTMVLLGVPAGDQNPSINTANLGWGRKIYKSLIGGIPETQEMLDYSVQNNIYPRVEVIPIEKVNEAYKNVLAGKVQFRYVIDMKSIGAF